MRLPFARLLERASCNEASAAMSHPLGKSDCRPRTDVRLIRIGDEYAGMWAVIVAYPIGLSV
jgi:hypothetical protein